MSTTIYLRPETADVQRLLDLSERILATAVADVSAAQWQDWQRQYRALELPERATLAGQEAWRRTYGYLRARRDEWVQLHTAPADQFFIPFEPAVKR